MSNETAIFAAGCFWGVEHNFRQVKGVSDVIVGYIGGDKEDPTYKEVCGGDTGHAEAVQISFDPAQVSFEDLLEVFWTTHDPTQLNRQGPDVGRQYRSAVFYVNEAQKERAEKTKPANAVTEITAAGTFWKAEEYHQRYIEKNGGGHCAI